MTRLATVLSMMGLALASIAAAPAHAHPCAEDPNIWCTVSEVTTEADCAVWTVTNHEGPVKDLPGELVPDCFIRP